MPDQSAAQRPEDVIRRALACEAPRWDSDRPAYDADRLAALDALDALVAERDRAVEALKAVGDGELTNLCWCGDEWCRAQEEEPLDEDFPHSEWCLFARAALAAGEPADDTAEFYEGTLGDGLDAAGEGDET